MQRMMPWSDLLGLCLLSKPPQISHVELQFSRPHSLLFIFFLMTGEFVRIIFPEMTKPLYAIIGAII